jgi:hypothetical protein
MRRKLRPRSGGSPVPRTYVGRWLRAIMLRQYELRDRLRLTLNGGRKTGWNDDEPAVVEVACELLLRRFFGTEYDAAAVTAFVADLREALADDATFSELKAEKAIRSALGESDTVTSDITSGQKMGIHLAAIALANGRLGSGAVAVDQVIAEAERIAFERGWHPPLAVS